MEKKLNMKWILGYAEVTVGWPGMKEWKRKWKLL